MKEGVTPTPTVHDETHPAERRTPRTRRRSAEPRKKESAATKAVVKNGSVPKIMGPVAPVRRTTGVKDGGHANASLEFSIDICEGEDLAACDRNLFGKKTSSDPYVIVALICNGEELLVGKTKRKKATLNPKWNETLFKTFPPGSFKSDHYTIQLKLFDHDMIGEHDAMGIVQIPMMLDNTSKPNEWYDVPPFSAPGARGRIQLAVETTLHYSMGTFMTGRRNSLESHTDAVPLNRATSSLHLPGTAVLESAAHSILGAGAAVGTAATATTMHLLEGAAGAGTAVASGATTAASTSATVATTAASTTMGVFSGASLWHSKQTEDEDKEDKVEVEYENIYKDEPVLTLMVTAHKGDGLVAKDRNTIGTKKVSSDPYIVLEIWPKGVPPEEAKNLSEYPMLKHGRSPTLHKTLCPVWNYAFEPFIIPIAQLDIDEAQLRVCIWDDDFGMGYDDSMGSFDLHLRPKENLSIREKWYAVSAVSATRASGRVQLSLSTVKANQKIVIGQKKKAPIAAKAIPKVTSTPDLPAFEEEGEDQEMSASMPTRKSQADPDAAAALLAADFERHAKAKGRLRKTNDRSRHAVSHRRHKDGADARQGHHRSTARGQESRSRGTKPEEGKRSHRARSQLPKEGGDKSSPGRRARSEKPVPRQRKASREKEGSPGASDGESRAAKGLSAWAAITDPNTGDPKESASTSRKDGDRISKSAHRKETEGIRKESTSHRRAASKSGRSRAERPNEIDASRESTSSRRRDEDRKRRPGTERKSMSQSDRASSSRGDTDKKQIPRSTSTDGNPREGEKRPTTRPTANGSSSRRGGDREQRKGKPTSRTPTGPKRSKSPTNGK